jgi:RNA polymerase sigma-70 factor, ECF subfamily
LENDDGQLVQRARAGDVQAFASLVEIHQRFVYNLALRALGDPGEAEDLAQEAFLRAWKGLPAFQGQAQFRTWLYRIVVNLCFNRLPGLRRQLNELAVEDAEETLPEMDPGPLAGIEAAERRAFLQAQIAGLPEGYRVMLALRFQQDLPYEEIARLLEIPLGTVKTGIFRARSRLREALRDYDALQVG